MPGEDKMSDAEVDRILSKADEIQPSSGFVASVMESVRREAAAPPPIPFPWKRALPILLLASVALALLVVILVGVVIETSRTQVAPVTSLPSITTLIPRGTVESTSLWTILSLIAAFISVKLSMRLAGGRT